MYLEKLIYQKKTISEISSFLRIDEEQAKIGLQVS